MADKSDPIGQDEIEQLLKRGAAGNPASTPPASPPPTPAGNATLGINEIESLLQSAVAGRSSTEAPMGGPTTRSEGESAAKRQARRRAEQWPAQNPGRHLPKADPPPAT